MSGVAEVSPKYLAEMASNSIPIGYKQTEVGVIPEDWEAVQLKQLFSLKNGYSFKGEFFSNKGPIVLTPGNFKLEGGLYFESRNTKRYEANYPKGYEFNKGDLVVVMTDLTPDCNLLGKPAFIEVEELILHNQRIGKITQLVKGWEIQFLFYTLLSPTYLSTIKNAATGSTVRHTSPGTIASAWVAEPPKPEQTAIANALSDVDALISELEKLIAKKQAIKIATMQQLLIGRTRLPQFALREDGTPTNSSGTNLDAGTGGPKGEGQDDLRKGTKPSELGEIPEDWEVAKIGDFAPLQRGFDLPSSSRVNGKYPVVYSNGIVNTHCHFQVKGPGVVTGRSGTLGKVHYVEDDYWPHNTSLWVTKFNGTAPKFIYFVFTYIGFERFASGSGVPTLNRNDAHSYKVVIPTTEAEQTAIATILSDMDAEIQALEQRLGKIRRIKQGMMQELLTGKTRLVQPLNKELQHG